MTLLSNVVASNNASLQTTMNNHTYPATQYKDTQSISQTLETINSRAPASTPKSNAGSPNARSNAGNWLRTYDNTKKTIKNRAAKPNQRSLELYKQINSGQQ
jgi:hypothetical protein